MSLWGEGFGFILGDKWKLRGKCGLYPQNNTWRVSKTVCGMSGGWRASIWRSFWRMSERGEKGINRNKMRSSKRRTRRVTSQTTGCPKWTLYKSQDRDAEVGVYIAYYQMQSYTWWHSGAFLPCTLLSHMELTGVTCLGSEQQPHGKSNLKAFCKAGVLNSGSCGCALSFDF